MTNRLLGAYFLILNVRVPGTPHGRFCKLKMRGSQRVNQVHFDIVKYGSIKSKLKTGATSMASF